MVNYEKFDFFSRVSGGDGASMAIYLLNFAGTALGAGEIGERLYISERTVNDHIASIYRKFGVRKRAEFMAMFVEK